MPIYVTAELIPPHNSTGYVLKDGERTLARLGEHATVESAYQFWKEESEKEFDFRSAGYLKVNWTFDDWDESLADQRQTEHIKRRQRARSMVELLEPYRNAAFVEAPWQLELRCQQEQRKAEENEKPRNVGRPKRTKHQKAAQAVRQTPKPDLRGARQPRRASQCKE